jgi:outer membrane protein assembly factor BamB
MLPLSEEANSYQFTVGYVHRSSPLRKDRVVKKRLIPGIVLLAAVVCLWIRGIGTGAPPPLLWQMTIPWLAAAELTASDDGTVYVLTYADELIAIDHKGKKQWTYSVPGTSFSSPVIGSEGTIYACASFRKTTNSGLTAFRPDGSIRWSFDVQGCVSSSLALGADSTIYVSGRDKCLWALTSAGSEKWHFKTTGDIYYPPAIAPDGSIVFHSSTTNNAITCLDPNGTLKFARPGNRLGGFGVSFDEKGTLYLTGGSNETIQAIGLDGSTRWIYSTPLSVLSAAVLDGSGNLYFSGRDSSGTFQLVALSGDRVPLWQVPLGYHHTLGSPVVAEDGTIYVASGDPKLTAINPNGVIKWVFKPRRPFPVLFKDWSRLPQFWKALFLRRNVLITPPVLTPKGVLYVGFGQPYSTLYAFNVGAGPSRKSPWPMDGANARRTRGTRLSASTRSDFLEP